MRRVKFTLSIGYPGADHEEIVEFDDDTTDEQIEEAYEDWRNNYLDGSWWEVDEEGKDKS